MYQITNLRTEKHQLLLDWLDVEEGVKALLPKLPYRPQVVLGLTRGGVIPASLIHRYFPRAKLEVLRVSSYEDRHKVNAPIYIEHKSLHNLEGKKVLIVDDVYDSGDSISQVLIRLKRVKNISLTCAVLVQKQPTALPVASAYFTNLNTWVTFPWEKVGIK